MTNPLNEVNQVANPRKPLRLNVGFIINAQIGYSRDFDFDIPLLTAGDDLTLADFKGLAKIGRTPQGLLVQGNFTGNAKQECVRCLSEYEQPLEWEFLELYAFDRKSVTESGLIVPEDAHIDLQPLVREFALLEFPIKPLCKPDCKGLCMVCGENLNEHDCGHRPDNDSPFAALKQLLDE
jgi:uncharacterized protein